MDEGNGIRVAINAQVQAGTSGGVAPFLGALVNALGKLDDGPDRYVLVGQGDNREWLESIKGDNQEIRVTEPGRPRWGHSLRSALAPMAKPFGRLLRGALSGRFGNQSPVTVSDGFWEGLGCDVVHFPFQQYVICNRPTLFNPHDLQHLHFPEYFSGTEYARREQVYPTACRHCGRIAVASSWVKEDIVRHYGTDPSKIKVIPWAAPTETFAELTDAQRHRLRVEQGLPDRFLLYPAATWPHKNHAALIEALAQLRDRDGLRIPLVCTGSSSAQDSRAATRARLDDLVRKLGLGDQVLFPGYVSDAEMRAVYEMCAAVVVPTLFEAASGPVFEAWQAGKPVACSTVTSLPEQVGSAALLFDPGSVTAIAEAVRAIWCDPELAADLTHRGRVRLSDFSWSRTARAYRAVYRELAGRKLNREERGLLAWDWMRDPQGRPE